MPDIFTPTEAQRPFIESSEPERWFIGETGSGKTTAGFLAFRREVLHRVANRRPPGPWLVLVPGRYQAIALWIFELRFPPDWWLPTNPQVKPWRNVPGIGRVALGQAKTRQDLWSWEGGAYAGIWIDGLHLMEDPAHVLAVARCKARVGPNPFLLVTTGDLAVDRFKMPTRSVWTASTASNPHVPDSYRARLEGR